MNNTEFILGVIDLYHNARLSKFKNEKVRRGRSRSVPSDTEDLFANFLFEKIHCDLIYVDQPITLDGAKKQFYPDIVVVKDGVIKAFCDLKMDLGWKRNDLYNFCKKLKEDLRGIKGKKCKIRDGVTKEDKWLNIDNEVSFNIVIVSGKNITSDKMEKHKNNIQLLGRDVELFILSDKKHPNKYGYKPDELIELMKVNDDEFERLFQKLG